MIVTIDGPAGAGKSSIARDLAVRLGFEFLDTGAMYRAMTLAAIRAQIDFDDTGELVEFAKGVQIRTESDRVFLGDDDVTDQIRNPTVTDSIRYVADVPQIRTQLSQLQRSVAQRSVSQGGHIVTEGRDQGTEVFPDAECKIFLTASPEERALRRQRQLADAGRPMALEDILRAQDLRDAQDRERPMGALRPAEDAFVIESDGMTSGQVLERALEIVEQTSKAPRVSDCS